MLAAASMSIPKVLLDFDGLLALVPELIAAADEAYLIGPGPARAS